MNNAKWDNDPVRKQDASVKVGLSTKQKSRQNCWHQTDSNQKRRLWIYLLLRECFWYSFNLGPNIFQFVKFRKIHAIKQACADIWYLDKQQIVKEIKLFFYVEEIVWHILPFDHSQYLLSHKEHNQTVEAKTVS